MIWLQGGLCFLIWLGYGVFQMRRAQEVRTWSVSIPRSKRGLLAAGLLVGSIIPIFAALTFSLKLNGFGPNGMKPIVWIAAALLGLLFVHGQTLATALLVTSAQESVTEARREASSTQETSPKDPT